ncbi:hypothetical protein [Alicyclobacillus fodiniaquatilis]|uniref:hypothetical protein n=1 Tax=Alicyclobacillus fodiniaquatilis TaxID=1661150 RepID=UPI00367038B0
MKPELEALLLEVPSPPISKLYGSLLEAYSTGVSPKRNKLIQDAEVRNHMVHRPEAEEISIPEVRTYVDHVEAAIYDLIKRLMPDDPTVTKIHRSVTLQSDSHERKPKKLKNGTYTAQFLC